MHRLVERICHQDWSVASRLSKFFAKSRCGIGKFLNRVLHDSTHWQKDNKAKWHTGRNKVLPCNTHREKTNHSFEPGNRFFHFFRFHIKPCPRNLYYLSRYPRYLRPRRPTRLDYG